MLLNLMSAVIRGKLFLTLKLYFFYMLEHLWYLTVSVRIHNVCSVGGQRPMSEAPTNARIEGSHVRAETEQKDKWALKC